MRILAFAYACEPGRGSEPGAGWSWARMLAGLGETWVVTRANNREAIEAGLEGLPEAGRLHFLYVDLPERARRWKRGRRGIDLYYLLWQAAALRAAREAHRRERFDLVWHLTLANVWFGSVAPLVGPDERSFGSTDLKVSALGLGAGRLGATLKQGSDRDTVGMLLEALDSGITFYDTADSYGQGKSEELIGRAFEGRRDQVVIATKAGYRLSSAAGVAARLKPVLRPCCARSSRCGGSPPAPAPPR